jgi:hypothetical protein
LQTTNDDGLLLINRMGCRWDVLLCNLLLKSTVYEAFAQWCHDGG